MKSNPLAVLASILFVVVQLSCTNSDSVRLLLKENGQGIEVLEAGVPVLFFQTKPSAIEENYERAGFVHPLYDLDGRVLTENGPADHPHHRGIFWAWHQISLNGKQVGDGWVSDKIRFVPQQWKAQLQGNDVLIDWKMNWAADSVDGKAKELVTEHTLIRVHPAGDSFRMIDFDIHLFPLCDSVAIAGSNDVKGYGGFSMRWKLPSDLRFETRDSFVTAREEALSGGPWMQFRGGFNSESESAVTLFCDSSFSGFRQDWILRDAAAKSMQNAVYPGPELTPLPTKGLRLRYRLLIQRHPFSADALEKLWHQYQNDLSTAN